MLITENKAWPTCVADLRGRPYFLPATPWPISAVAPWLTLVWRTPPFRGGAHKVSHGHAMGGPWPTLFCMQVSHASNGSPLAKKRREGRGNSSGNRDSCLRVSLFSQPTTHEEIRP
jgi:hypothetical protein